MDFGEKKIIRTFAEKIKARSAKIRAGFREAKSETRREKRAKSVFRATTILAAKIFPSFCENHPIFWVAISAC